MAGRAGRPLNLSGHPLRHGFILHVEAVEHKCQTVDLLAYGFIERGSGAMTGISAGT